MAPFFDDQDEPGPSRRGRRRRRASSISTISTISSGHFEMYESDDDDSVVSWQPWHMVHVGAGSLPPDPRRSPAPPEFRYNPLAEGHIRVLRVLAGTKQAKVRCELIHMSLRRPRPFIALSYAWGDKYDKTEIELTRCVFSVTSSLHGALRAIRETDQDVLVWADAVCINQEDANERSEQVQKMHLIYRKAALVGIWLGPEADDSSYAISLIEKLNEKGLSQKEVRRTIYSSSWSRHFHALVELFERDYWDRLWVVQEVNNAKHCAVYCGNNRTSWLNFIKVSGILSTCKDDLERRFFQVTQRGTTYPSQLINYGPMNLLPSDDRSLTDHLNNFRPRLASDPRDKLYGLLGILPDPIQRRFKPDYESPPTKLYIDIVEYVLQTTGCLDIICSAHKLFNVPQLLKLPSWVPDWSQSIRFQPLYNIPMFCNGSLFCASGSAGQQFELVGNTRSKLRIRAIYLGSVKAVGVRMVALHNEVDILMALINWWYLCMEYLTNGQESFCRTITLGQTNSREWRSFCLHIIGMMAAHYIPHLQLHRDLQPNPKIHIDFKEAQEIMANNVNHVSDQRFFVTTTNDIGLGRGEFHSNCVVCIPLGCKTPVILEPDRRHGGYLFAGDAYVDGFMYGEAVDLWRKGKLELRTYTLL